MHPLGVVTSAIDISDGLLGDLRHVAEASGVQLSIEADRIPIAEETRVVADRLGLDPMALALGSGEEYEIAFTVPADAVGRVLAAFGEAGARAATVIATARAGGE